MAKRNVHLVSLVGPGVTLKNQFVDVRPGYRFVDAGAVNWPDPITYQFENGELTIYGLEDTFEDLDVVWVFQFRNLDSRNQPIGPTRIEQVDFVGTSGTTVEYTDMRQVEEYIPPDYMPLVYTQTVEARDAAVAAQAAAETAAAAAAAVGATSDAQMATNVASGTLTSPAVTAKIAAQALTLGTASIAPTGVPYFERSSSGSQSTMHITAAPGWSAPYLIGIGVDFAATGPSQTGVVVANKASAKGLTVHQQSTISDVNAWGLYVHQQSTVASALVVEQNVTGAAHGLVLRVAVGSTPGAGQKLAKFEVAGNHLSGDIAADTGTFRWIDKMDLRETQFNTTATAYNGTGAGSPAMFVVTDPATNPAISEWSVNTANKSDGSLRFYRPNGSGAYFAWQLTTDTNIFRLQGASAAAKGSQSWNTLISATGASLAFYGAAPVPRAAAITQTYSTASRTVSNMTAVTTGLAAVATTASTLTSYGYTQAQADAIVTQVNLLITAVTALVGTDVPGAKNNLNSVIDDLQAIGVNQ